jgi:hypothetical protein
MNKAGFLDMVSFAVWTKDGETNVSAYVLVRKNDGADMLEYCVNSSNWWLGVKDSKGFDCIVTEAIMGRYRFIENLATSLRALDETENISALRN